MAGMRFFKGWLWPFKLIRRYTSPSNWGRGATTRASSTSPPTSSPAIRSWC